jgi:hypothetical protein
MVSGTISRFAALLLLAAPTAFATPTPACEVVTLEEVNAIAGGAAVQTQVHKSGNPTQCAWVDSKRAAVLVIWLREVQYAVENELQYERENLEKIYRGKVKWLQTVGDNAFWMPVNKQLVFRKGKTIVSVAFARKENQDEIHTAQVARMVETRLK